MRALQRMGRPALILFMAVLLGCTGYALDTWPTEEWPIVAPEEEGIDSGGLIDLYQSILTHRLNTHGMVITRNGRLISEAYFYPYQKNTMLNIHSCTKSVVSALVGIAIREGYLKGVHQKVCDFFPEMTFQDPSGLKRQMTLEHLLTMSSGFYAQYPDTGDQMQESPDWVQFILNLKMAARPGERFNYSDCDAHLVAAILQKATGMNLRDFAQFHLFKPLGIKAYWPQDPQGISTGWGNINMTPRDMAKFGYLFLNNGKWEGKQLIPAEWVAESTQKHIRERNENNIGSDDYGYFWWIGSDGVVSARGSGGQFIHISRQARTVIVNTNGFSQGDNLEIGKFGYCIRSDRALAANPASLAKLRAMESSFESGKPLSSRVSPLAAAISGKTIYFGKDGYRSIKLDFSRPDQALLQIVTQDDAVLEYRLCTDGGFFMDDSRRYYQDTIFLKGYWQDDRTFVVVCEKGERLVLTLTFEGDKVTFQLTDRGILDHYFSN